MAIFCSLARYLSEDIRDHVSDLAFKKTPKWVVGSSKPFTGNKVCFCCIPQQLYSLLTLPLLCREDAPLLAEHFKPLINHPERSYSVGIYPFIQNLVQIYLCAHKCCAIKSLEVSRGGREAA